MVWNAPKTSAPGREGACSRTAARPAIFSRTASALLFVWLVLFFFTPVTALAQQDSEVGSTREDVKDRVHYPHPSAGTPFERISLEQGLSQSSVRCILQDHYGYLWFCTEDGLNRYDGYSFVVYKHDPEIPSSLTSNLVLALVEDREGNLWVGTESGLDWYDRQNESFTHYRYDPEKPNGLSHDTVYSLLIDQEGTLWIGTAAGLCWFDPETGNLKNFRANPRAPEPVRKGEVVEILESSSGTLWFGTFEGLVSYNPKTEGFEIYQHAPDNFHSLSSNRVRTLYEDPAGTLWIGTDGGGINLLPKGSQIFTHLRSKEDKPGSLSDDDVRVIYGDRNGQIWIGTDGGGLERYVREKNMFVHHRHDPADDTSISHNTILSIYKDTSGILWVGTWAGGINKLVQNRKAFLHVHVQPGNSGSLKSNHIWGFHEDETGVLWIATLEGLSRLDRWTGKMSTFRHHPSDLASLGSNNVQSILRDRQGNLWVGTHGGGLNRYVEEKNGFIRYRFDEEDPHSPSADIIYRLYEDRAGRLWVGTARGLNLYRRESDDFLRLFEDVKGESILGSTEVWAFGEDQEGGLWLGTGYGLFRYHPDSGEMQHYRHDPENPNTLSTNFIFSIHVDTKGRVWVGTGGGGLNRLEPESGEIKRYFEKDGLPNDSVYGILEDRNGFLWLSTNMGLARFDPEKEIFRGYDAGDGLQSNEFNMGAYYQSSQGEMFFGGINGFNAFFPDEIQDNQTIPPVVLTSLSLTDGHTYQSGLLSNGKTVSLRWPIRSFEFEFAALNYINPEKNQYAYRLEGFDEAWNYTGNRRFGQYTNLPGGTYTLRVKGSNHDGVWNEAGTALRIAVVPPFWETGWYQVGVVVLLVFVVVSGVRFWVKGMENRTRQLELLVEERTRTLRQRSSELEERTWESERRSQELEVLYRADQELYRNLHLDQVLQALVDTAVEILGADKASLLVWDEIKERLVARAVRNFKEETVPRLCFLPGQGLAGWVAETGEPAIVLEAATDPRVTRDIIELEGIVSFMQVPIKVQGLVFGVFSADFVEPRELKNEDLDLLIALAERAAMAIQNAQLYERTQKTAVVEERSRLARELHDAVTQTLFSASLIAEALPSAWEQDTMEGRLLLQELRQLSRGALAEMRALLLELRPSTLAEAKLENLLRQLGEAVAGREGIQVSVSTESALNLPQEVRTALYRIAQEALNNVVKHASAARVDICLEVDDDFDAGQDEGAPYGVTLIVKDDGAGFDMGQISSDHLGLGIMQERAQAIGAELVIESRPEFGTQVTVRWERNGRKETA